MQDSEFDTIQQLISASNGGDEDARETLFDQVQDFLRLMADKHLDMNMRHKIAASDIVQQTFCNAVKNLDGFRGENAAEFHGWLKAIVINEVKNARRDLRTAKRDFTKEKTIEVDGSGVGDWQHPADENMTPSSKALSDEQVENFYEILKQLPPDHAEVIQLRSIEQLGFKEVAEKMGRTQNAVTKLWYRAVVGFEDLLRASEAFKSRANQPTD